MQNKPLPWDEIKQLKNTFSHFIGKDWTLILLFLQYCTSIYSSLSVPLRTQYTYCYASSVSMYSMSLFSIRLLTIYHNLSCGGNTCWTKKIGHFKNEKWSWDSSKSIGPDPQHWFQLFFLNNHLTFCFECWVWIE